MNMGIFPVDSGIEKKHENKFRMCQSTVYVSGMHKLKWVEKRFWIFFCDRFWIFFCFLGFRLPSTVFPLFSLFFSIGFAALPDFVIVFFIGVLTFY